VRKRLIYGYSKRLHTHFALIESNEYGTGYYYMNEDEIFLPNEVTDVKRKTAKEFSRQCKYVSLKNAVKEQLKSLPYV
jgi:hypothetical protein